MTDGVVIFGAAKVEGVRRRLTPTVIIRGVVKEIGVGVPTDDGVLIYPSSGNLEPSVENVVPKVDVVPERPPVIATERTRRLAHNRLRGIRLFELDRGIRGFGCDGDHPHDEQAALGEEVDDDDPLQEERAAFGSVPIREAAESPTEYVTITAEIATVQDLGEDRAGVKAILKDATGAMDLMVWRGGFPEWGPDGRTSKGHPSSPNPSRSITMTTMKPENSAP